MSAALSFESQQQTLILRGELDRETLLPLWRQRDALLADKTAIDVAQLQRVDSSGLALLLHLREQQRQRGVELKISGATDRLKTLVALYNLQAIMPVDTAG
ncbi:lipid asymmetry maintenance protein MlaB [Serratia ficaria]|uniref:Probable phospholipid ABC transporter-binding protein mlaB n=1 Tax=Serratia ficaria TaxID=61651 RepID=A0A240CBB1_SERFI|nr:MULTISPECIES: lipid asymmetry maintenance protein MlaB [Serratia]MEE4484003.1 lipid asymmetry maintenance protein MlaB [Serratia ficaria]REF42959.1 phospholipid transport system transporter-binding protein [Serratia ficaria]CAI0811408.1 Probable phospholipid ABC transporter-binding protein mlaB [Serratia ficaria]CAI1051042.1 Probable phospholipid ABC transporter-binding protein mlaB [Serratia ficaria]CAI1061247.1 Probable phospholipid ABC transporter-binding protein mlaB [Serratia ficaria]